MTTVNQQQLVHAAQRGDRTALGELLKLHQQRLYNVCLRMVGHREDAAEVAQEAMLKIVQHAHDFRGQSDVATWMIRIAMNLSISHLRRRKLRQTASLDRAYGDDPPDDQSRALRLQLADHREPPPDSGVQQKEMLAHLQTALGRLDEEFRAVLVLRDIDEMDYQGIAAVLAVPVGTVKSRLFRARLALRHEMFRLCPPNHVEGSSGQEAGRG